MRCRRWSAKGALRNEDHTARPRLDETARAGRERDSERQSVARFQIDAVAKNGGRTAALVFGVVCKSLLENGGAEGDRTPDLVNAIHARSQLRYSPTGETLILPERARDGQR